MSLACLALATCRAPGAGAPQPQPLGAVLVRPHERHSPRRPVDAAWAQLLAPGGGAPVREVRGAGGQEALLLDSVPPGRYVLRVRRLGFRALERPVRVRAGRTDTLRLALERPDCDLDCDPAVVPDPAARPGGRFRGGHRRTGR